MIKGALHFRIFMEISPYQSEFLVFRDLITLSISYVVALFQLILRNMVHIKFVNLAFGRIHVTYRISVVLFYVANNSVSYS